MRIDSVTPKTFGPSVTVRAAPPRRSGAERGLLVVIILFLDSLVRQAVAHFYSPEDYANSPISQVVWFAVYVYAIGGLTVERRRAAALIRNSLPIVIVIALAAFSVLWSSDPSVTAKRAFGLFGTTAIGYYIAARFALPEFLEVLMVATGISALLSLAAIVGLPRTGVMQFEYAGAWQGIYGHKNYLASAMVVGLVTASTVFLNANGRRRALYAGLFSLFALLLVGSRSVTSTLIATVVVGLIPLVLLLRSERYLWRLVTGLAIVAALGAVSIVIGSFGATLSQFFDLLGRDSTLTGRTEIWPYVVLAISDHPWLGFGYSVFWLSSGPVQQYITTDWLPYHAHNGFLELTLDIGFIGTAAFVLGIVSGLWRAVQCAASNTASRLTIWPFLMLVYFALANITESSIAKYNNITWVIAIAAFLYAMPPGEMQQIRPLADEGHHEPGCSRSHSRPCTISPRSAGRPRSARRPARAGSSSRWPGPNNTSGRRNTS